MRSKLFKLKLKDFAKGLVVAIITSVLTFIIQQLQVTGEVNFKQIGVSAAIALCSYLLKNLFTNSDDAFVTSEKN